jgi:hypothetical protein
MAWRSSRTGAAGATPVALDLPELEEAEPLFDPLHDDADGESVN